MKNLSLAFALSLLTLPLCANQAIPAKIQPNYDLLMKQCDFILISFSKMGDISGVYCYEYICEYLKKQNTAAAAKVLKDLFLAKRFPIYELNIHPSLLLANQATRLLGQNPITQFYSIISY